MGVAGHLDLGPSLVRYLGAALVMLGYFLNQRGRLPSEDWRFPAMNLLGSALVLVSLLCHPNLPSVVIEVFWSSISIYGIRKNLRTRREAASRRLHVWRRAADGRMRAPQPTAEPRTEAPTTGVAAPGRRW